MELKKSQNNIKFLIEPNINSATVANSVFTKQLSDAEIFYDLIRNNIKIKNSSQIEKDDVVTIDIIFNGEILVSNAQFVEGKEYFAQKIQDDILGHKPSENIVSIYLDRTVNILIKSVKRIIRPAISDELVKLASANGVDTVSQYRQYFLENNTESIKQKIAKQYVQSIIAQIVNNSKIEYDEKIVNEMYEAQKVYLQRRTFRNNREKYIEGLEQTFKNKAKENTMEAYEDCYKDMIRQQYLNSLVGKWFADKNGYEVTESEYQEYCNQLCRNYNTTMEEIKKEMTKDIFDKRKYSEYLQNLVIEHYSHLVKVVLGQN